MTPAVDFPMLLKWGTLFAFGSVCMRSAGCIFNDLCDMPFDAKVERTRNRPLVLGLITRKQALFPFIFFLCGGGSIWFLLNAQAKLLSLAALGLLFLYPFTKRFFVFPQCILGFAFNSGVFIAVSHLKPELLLTPQPYILYGIGLCWTLYYDTLYATQDVRDDLLIGLYSTAVFFKDNLKLALAGFYFAMSFLMAVLGCFLGGDIWFYLTLLLGVFYDIGIEIRRFNPKDHRAALSLFHHCILIGLGIFLLILFPKESQSLLGF